MNEDFLKSQSYNGEHLVLAMTHKTIMGVFWFTFWLTGSTNSLMAFNLWRIFPDGCPKWNYFLADYVLGLLFMLELTAMDFIYFTAIMSYEIFVI